MRKFAFAMSVLALAFTASAPARAGFVVVKFDPGYCQIWWDSGVKPLGTGWSYMGKPFADLHGGLGSSQRRVGQQGLHVGFSTGRISRSSG